MTHTKFVLALFVAFCCLLVSQRTDARIVVSEVMWPGSHVSTADEWIELTAITSGSGSTSIHLSGWTLTSQNSSGEEKEIIKFSSGTFIASGQYLLIANYASGDSALNVQPDVVTTAVSLPNTKLLLRLYDASGALVDVVDDGIGTPFAGLNESGSGMKASMERINFALSGSTKENWQTAATFVGFDSGANLLGTPGFPNGTGKVFEVPETQTGEVIDLPTQTGSTTNSSISIPPVRITEVLANPIGKDDSEWIEIANLGTGAVNIEGWILDDGNSPDHYVITGGSGFSGFLLEPDAYVSFPKTVTGLPLDNKGEVITLMSGDLLIDSLEYFETAEEVSVGLNGSGSLQPYCVPTESGPNEDQVMPIEIGIQSTNGTISASGSKVTREEKVSLNLEAVSTSGSLAHVACYWDFGSGFTSESCNPPSRTFKQYGESVVTLEANTYCDNTIKQQISINVIEKPKVHSGAGGGGGSKSVPEPSCTPLSFGGVVISEFIPNPYGDEEEGEWIELQNTTSRTVGLCGWKIDDSEGGSKPFSLDGLSILQGEFLQLPRSMTKVALNNSGDEVRLFGPNSYEAPIDSVLFQKSIEGESYALRSDGHYVWTPYLTPEQSNKFRSAERRYPTDTVVVAAALPDPVGKDAEGEWIEIANVSEQSVDLTGWQLDNKPGSTPPYSLDGVTLDPDKEKRFSIQETGINLVNSQDVVRLLDPDGYSVSTFGWTEAVEGRVYRRPVIVTDSIPARVINVVDGDTIDIVFDFADDLERAPPSLRRRWKGVEGTSTPYIRVRMIGVDTPETVHPSKEIEHFGKEASNFSKALLENKKIELKFDTEIWDKYNRLLAYVQVSESESVQEKLLRSGLATAYVRFPFLLSDHYIALEQEARNAKLGMWAEDTVVLTLEKEDEEELLEEEEIEEKEELEQVKELIYDQPISISEVYPAPNKGEYEWIELYNSGTGTVNLSGWILDDIRSGGSKEWAIPEGVEITGSGYVVITSENFSLKLNNGGDEVWLLDPNGEVKDSMSYEKIKKGQSVISDCVTDVPTLGTPNTCEQIQEAKTSKKSVKNFILGGIEQKNYSNKTARKSTSKSKPNLGLRTVYRNAVDGHWELQQEIPESHRYLASFLQSDTSESQNEFTSFSFNHRILGILLQIAFWYLVSTLLHRPFRFSSS